MQKILEASDSINCTLVYLQKHPYKVQKFMEEPIARLEIVKVSERADILSLQDLHPTYISIHQLIIDGDDCPVFEMGWHHLQLCLINVQKNFNGAYHGGLINGQDTNGEFLGLDQR